MKVTHDGKQTPYRRNSYRENSKSSYYSSREGQKPQYNFIEQSKIRIVQDYLVSVSGLPTQYDDPDLLSDKLHFGKYGTVDKIIISTQGKNRSAFIQVYITYEKSCEAAFAIRAMDGIKIQGREISATFGTTKYCTYFLKQNQCRNQKCFYLHAYDTKNQLMDGVKNNLNFLDEKSEKIISSNLKRYLENQLVQKENKQQSDFPTTQETIQYLIDEGILKEQVVSRLRKQVKQSYSKEQSNQDKKLIAKNKQDKDQTGKPKVEKVIGKNKEQKVIGKNKEQKLMGKNKEQKLMGKNSNSEDFSSQISQIQNSSSQFGGSNVSNKSEDQSQRNQSDAEQDHIQLTQMVNQLQTNKNIKSLSLSTASSPTKYQKLADIQQQSLDKTIQRRIIKQIMRNNMIFRSKMDFVTKLSPNVKEENNKIKNYVRKHLLNQI